MSCRQISLLVHRRSRRLSVPSNIVATFMSPDATTMNDFSKPTEPGYSNSDLNATRVNFPFPY